jgi:ethanolamine permease
MPKRRVPGGSALGSATADELATWQAAGFSLAVVGVAALSGWSALVAAVMLAPMVWVFGRLRQHAPESLSTSDLVGGAVGERMALMTGLIQLAAYVLLGVHLAWAVGLEVVLEAVGPTPVPSRGWWAFCSIAAVVVAGVMTSLRLRVIASVAAILAATGLLIQFYLALAVAAEKASGTEPRFPTSAISPPDYHSSLDLGWWWIVELGLVFVGFEVVTTLNRQVGSVNRPMGLAIGATAVCALTVGLQVKWAGIGRIGVLAADYLGDAGAYWYLVGLLALSCAGLLAISTAAVRVLTRLTEQLTSTSRAGTVPVVLVAVMAALILVLSLNWGDVSSKLGNVAPLLLLVLYVLAAEANARIPGSGYAAQAVRVFMALLLAGVVITFAGISQIYYRATFSQAPEVWQLAITAGIVAIAAMTAFGRRGERSARRQVPDTRV